MSTLRGLSLISARVFIPPAGAWWAKCVLSSGGAPALGPADLVIGDLTLRGTVAISGVDTPDAPSCVVYGGAGWRTLLPREGRYSAPGGVRLLTVLADLARLTQETYDAPADALLPASYQWPASADGAQIRASAVLDDLVTRGAIPTWRVDPATGRTRFDAWPSIGAADGRAQITDRDLRIGVRHLGLDGRVAALLPGATLEGAPIRRLVIDDMAGATTAEAWSDAMPTIQRSWRAMVLKAFPWLAFLGIDASGDLAIRSATTKVHLAGDKSDPAAARVGDAGDGGGIAFYPGVPGTTPPSLWYTSNRAAPYTWSKVTECPITGPLSTDAGTRVATIITTGSEKVTIK